MFKKQLFAFILFTTVLTHTAEALLVKERTAEYQATIASISSCFQVTQFEPEENYFAEKADSLIDKLVKTGYDQSQIEVAILQKLIKGALPDYNRARTYFRTRKKT